MSERKRAERIFNRILARDKAQAEAERRRAERCGGTRVLPQGGHEGTTRYSCPGCPDCVEED